MSNNIVFGITFKADGSGFVGEAKIAREELARMGGAGKASGDQIASGAAKGQAGIESAGAATNSLSGMFAKLGAVALAAFGVHQVVGFARSLVETQIAADGFNAKMAIAAGSAKAAAAEYDHMRQLSHRLGTELTSTADAYANFASAARGSALEGAKAREVFSGVAAASAKMNLTVDAQKGVFYALSQMMSKGVVSAEEFRQQLGERLPIATSAAATALNVTTAEFGELLNSGKLVSEEFLPKFAAQLEAMAGGGGPVDTLQAQLNRATNNMTEFNKSIAEGASLKAVADYWVELSAGLAEVAKEAGRAGKEYGVLMELFGFVGLGMAKLAGIEIDPQLRAQAELNEMLKEQLTLKRDISIMSARGGALEAEKTAEARARLVELNAEIKKQIEMVNAPINAAGAEAGKRRLDELAKAAEAAAAPVKKLADEQTRAIAAEAKSYAKLTESTTAHIAVLGAEADATAKLPKAYQDLIGYLANYKKGLTAENEAKQQATIATLAQAAGMEIAAAASDAAGKAAEKQATEEKKRIDALNGSVAADQKALDALTRKNDLLELGIVSVEQMALAELNLQAAMLDSTTVTAAEVIALQKRIDIAQQMIDQANRGEHIKAVQGEAEQADKAWRKTCEGINDGLTDAIWRGFESGKGFGQNFIDTVKNMFNTLVLRPIISAVMSPVSGAITAGMGAMGFSGAANAAGTGSDLLGLASMGSSIAGFGSAVATGFSLSATAATTAAEAYSLAGMGATSFGLQLGNMAAAIPGWGWAIAGGLALAGMLGGNGGTPTASTGHAVIDYDAAGNQTGYQSLYGVQNAATDATAAGMNASYRNIADSLGIGTVATQFGYAGNTGEDGKKPMFGLNGGAVGGPQFVQGETAYSDAAMGEAASRAVFAALQGSDLPGYLAGVFNGLDASKMSGQDINNTLAFAATLKSVRTGLTETVTPISAAQKALDGIGSTAATFTTDFVAAIDAGMTPEKLAQWQQAGAALGQLGDMSLNMSAAIPQLTQTTWEMWNTQTTSVRGLISTFDGSVAATYALSAATKERYATEQQLVNQISGAMSSLGTMFAGSAEQMNLSVMDSQQKSNYWVDRANSLQSQMEAATDPAKIESLARQWNEASNNAWASLDNTQRTIMLDSYLADTERTSNMVQTKLGKTLDDILQTSETELPALIAAAVGDAMTAFVAAQAVVAAAQAAAANTMQSAANTMQTVADKPVNVKVDVDFNANVPGSTQVAVLP